MSGPLSQAVLSPKTTAERSSTCVFHSVIWVGSSGDLSQAAEVDGVTALRQAGSTLKPFLYALALERRALTLANAYRSLANGGQWSPLRVTPGKAAAAPPCSQEGCAGVFGGGPHAACRFEKNGPDAGRSTAARFGGCGCQLPADRPDLELLPNIYRPPPESRRRGEI